MFKPSELFFFINLCYEPLPALWLGGLDNTQLIMSSYSLIVIWCLKVKSPIDTYRTEK